MHSAGTFLAHTLYKHMRQLFNIYQYFTSKYVCLLALIFVPYNGNYLTTTWSTIECYTRKQHLVLFVLSLTFYTIISNTVFLLHKSSFYRIQTYLQYV